MPDALPFETAFDLLPVAAGVVDLDGTILTYNAVGCAIIGRPRSEIVGKKTWDFAPGADHIWPDIVAGACTHGEYRGEITLVTAFGPRSVLYVFAPRRLESRTVLVVCAVEHDGGRDAARTADRSADQRLEALGLVAGGIAHDFNNQLVSVLAEATAARDEAHLAEATRDSLVRIEAAANRMAQLTRQLLAYAGRGRFVSELLDPDELLRASRDQLASQVEPGIELRIQPAAGAVAIEADRSLMTQLIGNLVSNASEAQRGQGAIEISTSTISAADGGLRWQLQLRDRGVGMDPDTIERIWDPFFTTKPDHHGLGLSAVVGIVRRMGGEISVESRPGNGATFTLRVPIVNGARPQAPRARATGTDAPTLLRRSSPLKGMRALVADDEPSVRATIKRMLERRDVTVVLAADGLEAKQLLQEGSYNFILLDVMMPGLTGYQLLPIARTAQPDAKLMLMSGYTDIASSAGDDVPDQFLEKPFTSKGFEEAIKLLVGTR